LLLFWCRPSFSFFSPSSLQRTVTDS
jgi:hypothetical protein